MGGYRFALPGYWLSNCPINGTGRWLEPKTWYERNWLLNRFTAPISGRASSTAHGNLIGAITCARLAYLVDKVAWPQPFGVLRSW